MNIICACWVAMQSYWAVQIRWTAQIPNFTLYQEKVCKYLLQRSGFQYDWTKYMQPHTSQMNVHWFPTICICLDVIYLIVVIVSDILYLCIQLYSSHWNWGTHIVKQKNISCHPNVSFLKAMAKWSSNDFSKLMNGKPHKSQLLVGKSIKSAKKSHLLPSTQVFLSGSKKLNLNFVNGHQLYIFCLKNT